MAGELTGSAAALGPYAFAAAAVFEVIGGLGASKARKRAAKRRAAMLLRQAEEKRRTTRLQVDAFKKQSKVQMGENISAFAKAGVDISGSPLMVLGQNAKESSNQAAEMTRVGNEEANLIQAGAQISMSEARAESRAAPINAIGTLLGGFGQAVR